MALGDVLHLAGVEPVVAQVDLDIAPAGRLGHQEREPEEEHHADARDEQRLAGVATALGDGHQRASSTGGTASARP